MIKTNKLMKKRKKRQYNIYFFKLLILALFATYLFSGQFVFAQETNTNQNLEAAGSTSQNYQLNSSVISPTGDLIQSNNYQILGTFGELGVGSYESTNYILQIGFPAMVGGKKAGGGTEEKPKPSTIIEIPEAINNIVQDISDSINKQIDKVVARLPAPVRKFLTSTNAAINKVVNQVRNSQQIMQAVNDVIQPTVLTTAAVSVLAVTATSSTALELTNMTYLLFRFGYFWLLPLSFGKKRKPWGVVFDSTSGRPIRGAIIRISSREFNKVRESQITDAAGRFGFLVDQGDYYVAVQKPGYVFPSSLITTAVVSQYHNIYRGETINVKERKEGILNINIPLDPERAQVTKRRIVWLRVLNMLGIILEKINVPLLVTGTVISWAISIVEPKLLNYIILLVYGILLLMKVFLFRGIRRSWGRVVESESNLPIEQALIRIYNLQTGTLAATRVTNRDGRFTALVNPGDYYLVVMKPGYVTYQTGHVTVAKEKGILRLTIKLKKEIQTQPASSPLAAS